MSTLTIILFMILNKQYITIQYHLDTPVACSNAKEEQRLAYGAYHLSDAPTQVMSMVCVEDRTGVAW